eukprot:309441-Rhodomonas_salina.1
MAIDSKYGFQPGPGCFAMEKDKVLEEKASEVWRVETHEMMGCRYAKHTIQLIYNMTYHMT